MELPGTFGEWLRQGRDQLRLTRGEFAGRVGCSVSALRKIEDGERRPSSLIAELMANCLNVPLAERSTFVKVARGDLSVDRLLPPSQLLTGSSPPSPAAFPRTNLPVLPTPLIGRQHEVEELTRLLHDPQCRMLTLTGPGGIGKSRLAIEAASQVQDAFSDGVYFIPLASAPSTRIIVPAMADAVGFAFQRAGFADPEAQLLGYLADKQTLLLADGLEHLLVEPGIELLAGLLAGAPQVKLLVTSRESLGLQGEWVFEVQGLPVPEDGHAEENAKDTSVELFLQRARRAHVRFEATLADYPAILRICRMVDGMPLGIELAAAWVRTLACDEIAREIERGLDFLSVSTRDLPARHRSMRAVFDHSWKLLSSEEQTILLRLSAFRGGFQREAAEVVAEASLPALSALVTKSLVRRSGTGRYDLHELIRQFAAEHLAEHPEELIATRARHGEYYLTFFGQADERLRSPAQREALADLTAEMDNFHAAWDWAITQCEFALIGQTTHLLAWFYDTRGWFQEGLEALGRAANALEASHGPSPPDKRDQVALARILAARSLLAYRLAHYEQAQAMLERSLAILRQLNETRVMVEAIYFLGLLMEVTGRYARALQLYAEGLEIATTIGDRWYRSLCLINLCGLLAITDPTVRENTHERLQSTVADSRAIGDPRLTAFGLRLLSQSAFALRRYDEARVALEESAALSIPGGDGWGLGSAYRGLGIIAQAQGRHQEAVDLFHNSLDTFTELGGRWWVARVLAEMSRSILALGDEAEAERVWHESLQVAIEAHAIPVALEALAGLASLQAKRGQVVQALELLLIVLTHPASFQETKNRAAELRVELESHLTPQQIQAVQAQAEGESYEQFVSQVLRRSH